MPASRLAANSDAGGMVSRMPKGRGTTSIDPMTTTIVLLSLFKEDIIKELR
jgi:hypothetical protein